MVVKALKRQRNCALDIRRFFTRGPGTLPTVAKGEAFETLEPFGASLSRLEVTVHAGDQSGLLRLAELLTSARQLNYLRIYLAGRVADGTPYIVANFAPALSRALQASGLTTLPKLFTLELRNICCCDASERDSNPWTKVVQWQFVRDLTLSCHTFLHHFSAQLGPHVRCLSVQLDANFGLGNTAVSTCGHWPENSDAVRSSLLNFTALESLEIRNATAVIDETLLRHIGRTIRTLGVHADQSPEPTALEKGYLAPNDILTMALTCPRLQELMLDIPLNRVKVCNPCTSQYDE
jgi:hypothetical protein